MKRQTRRINNNAEDGWKNKAITKVRQTVSYVAAERKKNGTILRQYGNQQLDYSHVPSY